MSLLTTPSDVLSPILELIDFEDLARLYAVGNFALLTRLYHSRFIRRVTKVSAPSWLPDNVFLKRKPTSMARFSQATFLAYFLNIQDLHLDFTGQGTVFDAPELVLGLKLRSLTLKMNGAWGLLWDTQNRRVRPLNRIWTDMTTLYWADLKELDHRVCSDEALEDVGHHLPKKLLRLSVGNFARLPVPLIASLSPSITYLQINAREMSAHWPLAVKLPSGLEILELKVKGTAHRFAIDAASTPNLHTLSIHSNNLDFSSNLLPSTLTSIDARHLLSQSQLDRLPPHLVSLSLGYPLNKSLSSVQTHDMLYLPRTLTTLVLTAPKVTADGFLHLPRSLTILDCDFNVSVDLDVNIPNLPAGLVKFVHRGATWPGTDVSVHLLSMLPLSLTSLTIGFYGTAHLKYFPPNLRELSISTKIVMGPEDVANLPRAVTSLSFNDNVDLPYESHQSKQKLHFPPYLTYVYYACGNMLQSMSIPDLPKSITHLQYQGELETYCLPSLPTSLSFFYADSIKISSNITEALAEEYEAALESRRSGSKSAPIPFLNAQTDENGIFVTAADLFKRANALLPAQIINFAYDHFVLEPDDDLLAPLTPFLTGLDLTIRDWEICPFIPTPKKPSTSEAIGDPFSPSILNAPNHELPYVAPSTTLLPMPHLSLSNCTFLASHHAALAPNLKSLSIARVKPNPSMFNDWSYRDTLEPVNRFSEEDLMALPPTLTKFEFYGYELASGRINPMEDNEWLSRLPQLEYLHIDGPLLSPGAIPRLPQTLKTLIADQRFGIDESLFECLPRSLTHLECGLLSYTPPGAQLAPFHLLPPTLKRIILHKSFIDISGPCLTLCQVSQLRGEFNRASEALSHWQSFLASPIAKGIPIPADMTVLNLDGMIVKDSFFQRPMPDSITFMSVRGLSAELTTDSIPNWPKSLTSAHLASLAFTPSLIKPPPPTKLTEEEIENYVEPPVEDAALDWNFIKRRIMALAPPNLTQLDVDRKGISKGNQWIMQLKFFRNNWTAIDLPGNGLDDSALQSLPSTLKTLRLTACRSFSPFAARSLPKGLTELVVPQWPIAAQSFQNLPSGLTTLEIAPLTPTFTEDIIKVLPKTLVDLNLSTTTVRDETLILLPKGLESLKLRQIKLTGKMFKAPNGEGTSSKESSNSAGNITAEPTTLDYRVVTISTLIRAACKFLPSGVADLPTTKFELEPTSVLAALPASVDHILLPGAVNDIYHVSKPLKPGVTYRCLHQVPTATPAPVNPIAAPRRTKTDERIYEYRLLNPLFLHSANEKPATLSVHWITLSQEPFKLSKLPKTLQTFSCHRTGSHIVDENIVELPPNLTRLEIPHSQLLTPGCLKDLPRTLTHLDLDLQYFQPHTERLRDYKFYTPALSLPPRLKQVYWSSHLYVGDNTDSLVRFKEQDPEEQH